MIQSGKGVTEVLAELQDTELGLGTLQVACAAFRSDELTEYAIISLNI
jgi:hypothetical protein